MQKSFFSWLFFCFFLLSQSISLHAQLPARGAQVFTYSVQVGDTWQSLQQRFLDSRYTWQDLRDFNRLPAGFPLIPQQVIFLPQAWLKQQQASLEIIQVQGIHYWQRAEKKVLALPEARLRDGDTLLVSAEGSLSLALPDGSQILVKGPAELEIQALRQQVGSAALEVELRLKSGEIESLVQTTSPLPTKVKIITLQGEVVINGTRFTLSVTPKKSQLSVEQGLVRLQNDQGSVLAQQGFGSQMTADAPPTPPQALPSAPKLPKSSELIQAFPFTVDFSTVAEAVAYEVAIARDKDFQDIVYIEKVLSPALTIIHLDDGRYWLRVKSIDALGFKSISALARLNVKAQLQAPGLLAPKEGEVVNNLPVVFAWQSEAPMFLLEILSQNKPLTSQKHYLREQSVSLTLEAADLYFWRVIPMTEQEYAGESSPWQSFVYAPTLP
jgi:hypothetical protein